MCALATGLHHPEALVKRRSLPRYNFISSVINDLTIYHVRVLKDIHSGCFRRFLRDPNDCLCVDNVAWKGSTAVRHKCPHFLGIGIKGKSGLMTHWRTKLEDISSDFLASEGIANCGRRLLSYWLFGSIFARKQQLNSRMNNECIYRGEPELLSRYYPQGNLRASRNSTWLVGNIGRIRSWSSSLVRGNFYPRYAEMVTRSDSSAASRMGDN